MVGIAFALLTRIPIPRNTERRLNGVSMVVLGFDATICSEKTKRHSAFSVLLSVVFLTLIGMALAERSEAAAAGMDSSPSSRKPQLLKTRQVSDRTKTYTLEEYFNSRGQYEVRVILNEERWYAPTSQRTILIGRAIDVPSALTQKLSERDSVQPRKVTTWFIPMSLQILQPIEYLQSGDDPWPTARSLIENKLNTDNRWYSWVLFESIAPQLSLAISHSTEFFEQIKQEQIDLYDLEIRLKHLELQSPNDPFIPIARAVLAEGWQSVHDRVRNEKTRTYWMYAAADVALTATAAKAFSIANRWLSPATQALSDSAVGKAVANAYSNLNEALQKKASQAAAKVQKSSKVLAAGTARLGFIRLTAKEKVSRSIDYLQARSVIARVALKGMGHVTGVVKSGVAAMPYIALTQTTQIIAETLARPDDLFDSNPLVMARKMANDEDFVQNVAYMTNETFWMAGVNNYLDTAKKKIAICGAIGLVDSVTMALVIKGEANPIRVGFDAGWEAVIGNVQALADTSAIVYFQRLAEKTGNSKLRLLGYVIALVDQGVGYFGYAMVSRMVDDISTPTPVPPAQNSAPQLKLIPVMGPA